MITTCLLLIGDLLFGYFILSFSVIIKDILEGVGLTSGYNINLFSKYYWLPLIIIIMFFVHKVYTKRYPFWDETKEIVKALFFSFLLSVMIIFLKKDLETSRLFILMFFAMSIFTYPLGRYFYKVYLSKLGLFCKRLIIIGAGAAGKDVALGLMKDKEMGFRIVGFLDDNKIGEEISINGDKFQVLGKIKDLKKVLNEYQIDAVVIAIPSLRKDSLAKLAAEIQKYVKMFYIVPEMRGVALSNTELYHLFMEQLFLLKVNNNLNYLRNRILKRVFDLVISILLFSILLPIIVVLSILIKLDSEGSPFFIQDRLGENGRLFKCIKFRSMYINGDAMLEDYFKQSPEAMEEWVRYKKLRGDDPRVTKMGKFLRKTSLDELPQIFNVLLGNMSLVGPRPYLPREEGEMKTYKDFILLAKPGITGLWQVSGRNHLDFESRMKLDTWYVLNWSLWLDIVILFKTVKVVLKREGAY